MTAHTIFLADVSPHIRFLWSGFHLFMFITHHRSSLTSFPSSVTSNTPAEVHSDCGKDSTGLYSANTVLQWNMKACHTLPGFINTDQPWSSIQYLHYMTGTTVFFFFNRKPSITKQGLVFLFRPEALVNSVSICTWLKGIILFTGAVSYDFVYGPQCPFWNIMIGSYICHLGFIKMSVFYSQLLPYYLYQRRFYISFADWEEAKLNVIWFHNRHWYASEWTILEKHHVPDYSPLYRFLWSKGLLF